jgi:hypothetical protein
VNLYSIFLLCRSRTYRYSPVHNCRKFSAVLSTQLRNVCEIKEEPCATDFGTISLNNSIFNLPAGVSPMLISMNTIGRVEEDILSVTTACMSRTSFTFIRAD